MPEKNKKKRVLSFEWPNGRMTRVHACPPKPVKITWGFLSAAKSAGSF